MWHVVSLRPIIEESLFWELCEETELWLSEYLYVYSESYSFKKANCI